MMMRYITLLCAAILAYSGSVLAQGHSGANSNHTDTAVTVFNDKSYQLTIHQFDPGSKNDSKPNAIITFAHKAHRHIETLQVDSLFCAHPMIMFADMDNDGTKDVLVLNTPVAGNNWAYNLYLADDKNHKLNLVKGFYTVLNPVLDTAHNIIVSKAIFSKTVYSFFRIDKGNKLKNLGHSFEVANTEPGFMYQKVMRELIKKK